MDQHWACEYQRSSLRLLYGIFDVSNEMGGGAGTYDEEYGLCAFTIKYVIYAGMSDSPRISGLDLFLLRVFVDPPELSDSLAAAPQTYVMGVPTRSIRRMHRPRGTCKTFFCWNVSVSKAGYNLEEPRVKTIMICQERDHFPARAKGCPCVSLMYGTESSCSVVRVEVNYNCLLYLDTSAMMGQTAHLICEMSGQLGAVPEGEVPRTVRCMRVNYGQLHQMTLFGFGEQQVVMYGM